MKHSTLAKILGAFGLALVLLAATPGDAQARRGVMIFNTGEDIFEAGPLPETLADAPELANAVAGFKCDVLGIFWAYIHWGSCVPVAFEPGTDGYWDQPEITAAIAAKYTQSDMKMSFWAQFGRWIYLLLIVGGIATFFMRRKGASDEAPQAS